MTTKPSVYREMIEMHGYGFHHWAVASHDLNRDLADYRARGYRRTRSPNLRRRRRRYDREVDRLLGPMVSTVGFRTLTSTAKRHPPQG